MDRLEKQKLADGFIEWLRDEPAARCMLDIPNDNKPVEVWFENETRYDANVVFWNDKVHAMFVVWRLMDEDARLSREVVRRYKTPYRQADTLADFLRINGDDEKCLFEPQGEGEPVSDLPGSARVAAYRARVEQGQELFNEGDRNSYE